MTLSEIETTLEELVARHQNLNAELLSTLLLSAGWDDKNIKDALMLFKQRDTKQQNAVSSSSLPNPTQIPPAPSIKVAQEKEAKEDMTFLQSDGSTEKDIHIVESPDDIPLTRVEKKEPSLLSQINIPIPSVFNIELVPDKPEIKEKKNPEPVVVVERRREVPPRITREANKDTKKDEGILASFFGITFVSDPVKPTTEKKIEKPVETRQETVVEKRPPVMVSTPMHVESQVPPLIDEHPQKNMKAVEELTGKRDIHVDPPSIHIADTPSPNSEQTEKVMPVSFMKNSIFLEPEPQSLILRNEIPQEKITTKETEIPPDLPLLPFENSPHVWSFSRYKDVFHDGDKSKKETPLPPVLKPTPSPQVEVTIHQTPAIPTKTDQEEEEISLERTPMTRGDESLVFLAVTMLFVIIIILGYMYSNGRL